MSPPKKPKIDVMQRRGLKKLGKPTRSKRAKRDGKTVWVPAEVWRKQPKLVPVNKSPRKTPSYKMAGEAGRKIIAAENRAKRKAGQKVRVMFEPASVRKLRVVKIDGSTLHIHPSGYLPYIARVRFGETLSIKQKAALAKRGRLLSTMSSLIGAGAGVLTLGNKFILIPKRPMTMGVHPGKFHWVAGMADWYTWAKGRGHERPHETAGREAAEEVGGRLETTPTWFAAERVAKEIAGARAKVEFLGSGLKPVKAEKAPPLIMLQDLNINMIEVQHAINIKMARPDKFIEKNFDKVGDFKDSRLEGGLFKFKEDAKIKDKWEMQEAAVIPRTSRGIFLFLKSYRGQVTEAARLGLLAYAAELRKLGK